MKQWMLVGLLVVAGCASNKSAPQSGDGGQPPSGCSADQKSCGGTCVPKSNPATGCAAESCSPCALANASASCDSAGACAISACAQGKADCNQNAADGCEVDTKTSDAHCGACGSVCAAGKVCASGACVDKNVRVAEAWLATQTEGFCFEEYNQFMNLCGDVEYCFDKKFMRPYPEGLAADIGFIWDGTRDGIMFDMGGDCQLKRIGAGYQPDAGLVQAGANTTQMESGLSKGKHILSVQLTGKGVALYLDGLKVATGAAPTGPVELADACGPGIILGQRISYWYETGMKARWGHQGVFFFQVREKIGDENQYDLESVLATNTSTILRFDKSGVAGTTWKASVGDLVGVAKNPVKLVPEIDAAASGPLPTWKPLDQCK